MVEFEPDIDWGRAGWIGFGTALVLALLWVVYSFVGTFVFALFLYYSTRRVYGRVRRYVRPASLAAGLSLVLLALPAVLLLADTVAVALQELEQFARETDLEPYIGAAEPYLDVSRLVREPSMLVEQVGDFDYARALLLQATDYVGFIGNALLQLFVILAVAFYLLRDDHRLSRWAAEYYDEGGVLDDYVRAVDASLEKIFAGNILNAAVTAIVGVVTYSLLNTASPAAFGIPYPALIGMLAGIASLIPVIGMKLVYVPVTGYIAVLAYNNGTGWGFVALFFGVSFVVVDVIPDLLVRPYVSGGTLHTGSVMFAYILGPLLFGWYGIFLGPVILVFITHFARIVLPALLDETTLSPAFGVTYRPAGIDPTYLAESVGSVPPPSDRESPTPAADDATPEPASRSDETG